MIANAIQKSYRPTSIYCFGDWSKVLRYDILRNEWHSVQYSTSSAFKGEFKYTSVCRLAKSSDVLISGGCSVLNQRASNKSFRGCTEDRTISFMRTASMLIPRYGHSQAYLNGYVYVIGGFNHDDNPGQTPSTLRSCEKYSPSQNEWVSCSDLQTPRAYSGCCALSQESIYVFGGLNGFETTNAIEQYNSILDKWTVLYIKLPLKLAKLSAIALDRQSILIAGGIFGDTELSHQLLLPLQRSEVQILAK